jgi:hypothetical protein
MELNFTELPGRPWILNAVVPVSKHVQLSVSYNKEPGVGWYVGKPGSYEAALQMLDDRYPGIACLVSFEDNNSGNIWPQCDDAKLEKLVQRGRELVYAGAVEVYDRRSGAECADWGIRFLCAEGFDKAEKPNYAERIWGQGHRFIPAVQEAQACTI